MEVEIQYEACSLCGRIFPLDMLRWSSRATELLCPDCYAEEEGCGCEDV